VVGTIVLFTLAIIFLPDIFDGRKNELKQQYAVIPAKPIVEDEPALVVNTAQNTPSASVDAMPVSAPATVVKDKQAQSVVKPVVVPTAAKKDPVFTRTGWVIQMGIFKQVSSVKPYLGKLRAKGFTAFSVPSTPRAGESTTVYVGPELDREKLAKLQPTLKKAFNESGYLKKFDPTPNRK